METLKQRRICCYSWLFFSTHFFNFFYSHAFIPLRCISRLFPLRCLFPLQITEHFSIPSISASFWLQRIWATIYFSSPDIPMTNIFFLPSLPASILCNYLYIFLVCIFPTASLFFTYFLQQSIFLQLVPCFFITPKRFSLQFILLWSIFSVPTHINHSWKFF